MSSDPASKGSVKQRLAHEMKEYLAIAAYLAAFFVSLTTYRKLVLAEYHVGYFAYGWALMEAMILAKVILIGQALHLGDRFRDRPLIVSTLWKSIVFGLLVAVFVVLEHVVTALLHHRPVKSEFQLTGGQGYEMLARVQLMLVAFVPFFAFREISAVLGEGKLLELFFHGRGGGDAKTSH
jgi:hypothetical protein